MLGETSKKQSNLLQNILEFKNRARPRSKGDKQRKNTFKSINALYQGTELVLNDFKSGIFPLKPTQGSRMKLLTPKAIFPRLSIAFAQVKVGNTSVNIVNKIRQIINSLFRAKEITKKCITR